MLEPVLPHRKHYRTEYRSRDVAGSPSMVLSMASSANLVGRLFSAFVSCVHGVLASDKVVNDALYEVFGALEVKSSASLRSRACSFRSVGRGNDALRFGLGHFCAIAQHLLDVELRRGLRLSSATACWRAWFPCPWLVRDVRESRPVFPTRSRGAGPYSPRMAPAQA